MTGKSINNLPEYFLSVFIARHVHQHFKTFTFSMEDTVKAICASEEIDEALISRPGKVDIVVRSQRTGNIRHIIKLKRSYNVEGHIADIVRLAEFAVAAPAGHPLERNFMVMMAAASESASEARWGRMCELIRNQFNDKITLICTPISLDEEMLSTREGRTNDKPLMGEVWEVRYEDENC